MRRVRRKGVNKEKVFGCDLLEHLNTSCQEIPLVLRCCSEFVEEHGVVDGIYRLSGVSSNIQKLRSEFESDGSPDLNKDVYLQDIHCVSSLCKAYFRELPNPLLTYQLYDKFAEAVAIQLEEERLVKIRDVLTELPALHYRTLEYLMRHLVRMASYSSETNMHARNLAIVWAPNLLRSKDIEASGFNGTAAFMEVRVQSIVVEFILTHVPQLFPGEDASGERRKSLPSPSAMYSQDVLFQRAAHMQPAVNFGNISPGDGPLPIRPYHAIIEGTDKRKGSLKGKKWMSIFNIGGRFQETRKKHKSSTKEKEKVVLRPARSMDSLSTPSYPNEGSRRSGQRPPSTNMTPMLPPSPQSGSNVSPAAGGMGGSEYAVTYRRGTGLVSGGAGTMGTYTVIDPEGLGLPSSEVVQARSPGLSSKAGRRAAMHITGPTTVTVPLHITSNLALGVLQGAGSDRLIHRGRDKDLGDKVEGKEEGDKLESKEPRRTKRKSAESREVEEVQESESMRPQAHEKDNSNVSEEQGCGVKMGKDKEVKSSTKQELTMTDQGASREQQTKSYNSNTSQSVGHEEDGSEYIEMKKTEKLEDGSGNDEVFDASHILNSTGREGYDIELSGYVQDNFDFLDHMDCSVLDHMDSSAPYQVNEFSVEPPGHSDDEYDMMEQAQPSHYPAVAQEGATPVHDMNFHSEATVKPHRPLSLDLHSRHTKSLSLPYITSPIHGQQESSSEGEASAEEDSHDEDYSSGEDESMFVQSLPADFLLSTLSGLELGTKEPKCSQSDQGQIEEVPSSEEKHCPPPCLELPPNKETITSDEEQEERDEEEDKDGPEKTDDQGNESKEVEEHPSVIRDAQSQKPSETLTACCVEFPSSEKEDESNSAAEMKKNEDNDDISPIDSSSEIPLCIPQPETVPPEKFIETVVSTKDPSGDDAPKNEDECQQSVLETTEGTEDTCQDLTINEQESEMCLENHDLWNDLEDVVCEVIEERENEQSEAEATQVMNEEEDRQAGSGSEEKIVKADEAETNKSEVREESEGETVKTPEGKFTNSSSGKAETSNQETCGLTEETDKETDKEKKDKELDDELSRTPRSADKSPTIPKFRPKESNDSGMGEIDLLGVGRKLVVSKQPKVYQVKAVPVVPPKPQHCKITALTLRQQQQKERLEADKERDGLLRAQPETDKESRDGAEESLERQERQITPRERRRDGAECVMRDSSRRNSPLSLCFDEAVAIATMRREKERARDGEIDVDRLGK